MKRIISILLTTLITLAAFSGPIDIERAKKAAVNFISSVSVKQSLNLKAGSAQPRIKEVITEKLNLNEGLKTTSNEAAFYIINFVDGGYVIVSANDAALPIIGYGEGYLDLNNCPPQLTTLLNGYKKELGYIVANNIQPDNKCIRQWNMVDGLVQDEKKLKSTAATNTVGPLLTSTWYQYDGYDKYCPVIGGQLCAVGCVATAMAQIMYYYRFPSQGIGSNSYWWEDQNITLSANFGSTTYNYNDMSNSSPTDASALLSYHAGISVNMNYGIDGSGAYTRDVCNALVQYFSYKRTCRLISKGSYSSDADWISVLKNEINNGRPVYYSAADPNVKKGHAFVVDGYDMSDRLHINWGWKKPHDGYYFMGALNERTYEFNTDSEAIIEISPCPANLYITNTIIGERASYTAQNTITANNIISNGAVILYSAAASVKLNPGFKVNPGCNFICKLGDHCSASLAQNYSANFEMPNSELPIVNNEVNNSSQFKFSETVNSSFQIYPNPTNGILTLALKGATSSGRVVITNLAGKVVWNKVMDTDVQKIDLTSQPAGVYLVKVTTASSSYNTKLVIE